MVRSHEKELEEGEIPESPLLCDATFTTCVDSNSAQKHLLRHRPESRPSLLSDLERPLSARNGAKNYRASNREHYSKSRSRSRNNGSHKERKRVRRSCSSDDSDSLCSSASSDSSSNTDYCESYKRCERPEKTYKRRREEQRGSRERQSRHGPSRLSHRSRSRSHSTRRRDSKKKRAESRPSSSSPEQQRICATLACSSEQSTSDDSNNTTGKCKDYLVQNKSNGDVDLVGDESDEDDDEEMRIAKMRKQRMMLLEAARQREVARTENVSESPDTNSITAKNGDTTQLANQDTQAAAMAAQLDDVSSDENDMFKDICILGESDPQSNGGSPNFDSTETLKATQNQADGWDDSEGYYRMLPGEPFFNGKYTVQASLGRGVFSSVILARDSKVANTANQSSKSHEVNNLVAIKVIRNNESMRKAALNEVFILTHLRDLDPPGKKHVVRLLNHFEYRQHLCLVFEPLAMNLRTLLRKYGAGTGINIRAVRLYARQLFTALLHQRACGIVHADIKPDNLVVDESKTVLKVCDYGSAFVVAPKDNAIPHLGFAEKSAAGPGADKRIVGSPRLMLPNTHNANNAALSAASPSSLCSFDSIQYLPPGACGLQDMNVPVPYLSSRFYRAPEVILGIVPDFAVDVWAAACTLFEIFTGNVLFPGVHNNGMLRLHMQLKGLMPQKVARRGTLYTKYFDPSTSAFLAVETDSLGQPTVRALQLGSRPEKDLRVRLPRSCLGARDGELADQSSLNSFIAFLDRCLQLNPDKRMTPAEALSHPFLTRAESSTYTHKGLASGKK